MDKSSEIGVQSSVGVTGKSVPYDDILAAIKTASDFANRACFLADEICGAEAEACGGRPEGNHLGLMPQLAKHAEDLQLHIARGHHALSRIQDVFGRG